MNYAIPKVPPFGKFFGGKYRYSRQYLSYMNSEGMHTYCEPYAGAAGVAMNIPVGTFAREILADADRNVARTLLALRDDGERVKEFINDYFGTYTEETFNDARKLIGYGKTHVHAAAYIAANRMSSGGQFTRFGQSTGRKSLPPELRKTRLRGGRMGDANAYYNYIEKGIDLTIKRLKEFEIYNSCALELVSDLSNSDNSQGIMYFLDPPYMRHTRVAKNVYNREVDEMHHIELLELITRIPGKFYICGYYSDIYNQKLVIDNGWEFVTFDRQADSSNASTKPKRTEFLWISPPA